MHKNAKCVLMPIMVHDGFMWVKTHVTLKHALCDLLICGRIVCQHTSAMFLPNPGFHLRSFSLDVSVQIECIFIHARVENAYAHTYQLYPNAQNWVIFDRIRMQVVRSHPIVE